MEKAFEQGININIEDRYGKTLLLRFYYMLSYEIIELLLKNGADPNISDKISKNTVLHLILYEHSIDKIDIDKVKLLLQYGALVESKNFMGYTPIHVATERGHIEMVKVLIQHGDADISAKGPLFPKAVIYNGKSLIDSVPDNKPELKALLQLVTACKKINFT